MVILKNLINRHIILDQLQLFPNIQFCLKIDAYQNQKLDDKIASFFGCSVMTGVGVIYKHLSKVKNKNISIGLIGLGSVGFFSLLAFELS